MNQPVTKQQLPPSARIWCWSCWRNTKPHCATLSQDLMLFLLKNYKTALCHAWPGSDAVPVKELQNHIVPRLARIWWWSCWRTTKVHLPRGQDLMVVLLKNCKTALWHAQAGSDGCSVDEPQNRIVPRLARACMVSCCSNWPTKPHYVKVVSSLSCDHKQVLDDYRLQP